MHLLTDSHLTPQPVVLENPHRTNINGGARYISRLTETYPGLTVVSSEKDPADTEAALVDGIRRNAESTGLLTDRIIVISGDGVLGQTVNAIGNVRAKGTSMNTYEEVLARKAILQLIAAGNGCDGHREYLSSRRFDRPPMPEDWPYIKHLFPLHVTAAIPGEPELFELDVANYIGGGVSAELMNKMHDARSGLATKSRVGRFLQEYTIAQAIRQERHTIIVNGQELSDWTLANTRRMAKLAITGTSHGEPNFRELIHQPFSAHAHVASLAGKLLLQRPLNGVTHTGAMSAKFGTDVPVHVNGDYMGVWPAGTQITAHIIEDPILVASTRRPKSAAVTMATQFSTTTR